jgi:hypothetical protein
MIFATSLKPLRHAGDLKLFFGVFKKKYLLKIIEPKENELK